MSDILIDVKKLPETLRHDEQSLLKAIARGAVAGAHRARGIMVRLTPTDQGPLRAGWKVRTRSALPQSGVATVVELPNDAPHAGIIELGARPHGLSPAAWAQLYDWVRRHPELYGAKRARRPGRLKMGPRTALAEKRAEYHGADPEIADITNAIAAKLRREGQKPTYFIRNNLYRVNAALAQEIKREIDRLVASHGGYRGGR